MYNILIAEDMDIIALDIKSTLEDAGYNVVNVVSDSDSALSTVKNSCIDIAILDINLQGNYEGIDLGKTLKETYNIDIIFVTSYMESLMKSIDYAHVFLPKPYNEKKLLSHIKELCDS